MHKNSTIKQRFGKSLQKATPKELEAWLKDCLFEETRDCVNPIVNGCHKKQILHKLGRKA